MIKDILYERIRETLMLLPKSLKDDIYLIMFHIKNKADDPRKPMLIVTDNTMSHMKQSIKEAFDEAEAMWDYAYFLNEKRLVFGESEWEEGQIKEWIESHNLYFTDQKYQTNYERAKYLGQQITELWIQCCQEVVSKLHKEQIIETNFKHPVLILINQDGTLEELKELNEGINPKTVFLPFKNWVNDNL